MSRHDKEYWRARANRWAAAQANLHFILHDLRVVMPQTSGLQGPEREELKSAVDEIIGRHKNEELDLDQAIEEFLRLAFGDTATKRRGVVATRSRAL